VERTIVKAALLMAVACLLAAEAPQPAAKPYVRLFAIVNTKEARELNHLPAKELDKKLDDLTRWYCHFHGESSNQFPLGDPSADEAGVTLGAKLAKRGAMVSNYRNGSWVSQAREGDINFGEAGDIEKNAPLAIATWWPGHKDSFSGSDNDPAARLIGTVDAATTEIRVSDAAKYKPAHAPQEWPYIASRGEAKAYSLNSHDFVAWVLIDDEILRVKQVRAEKQAVILAVDRGHFGTKAAAHPEGARVMSPVYIGSSAGSHWDAGLAGAPPVDNPNKALRYGLKLWRADALAWVARRIEADFGNGKPAPYFQGYNTVWLDITSCSPYNTADAYGQPVLPWADSKGTVVTADDWSGYQMEKVSAFKSQLESAGYPHLMFTANNLGARAHNGECQNKMLASGAFDAGSLEHWLQVGAEWETAMAQNFQIQEHDWPAIYWAKSSELAKGFALGQYKRFTYGSLLLAYNAAATKFQYGGPFGLEKPDDLYFYDWGKPAGAQKKLANSLHRRDFENGCVLVNPTNAAIAVALSGELWDVSKGNASKTASVAVGTHDAAFLMNAEGRACKDVLPER
jgi:hypothetical protein